MTALAQAVPRPRARAAGLAFDLALVVGGSLFIAGLAQVVILLPFTPVPITGQTLGVLVIGAAYGWARALATLSLYLVWIALGLPFAAEGQGGWEVLTFAKASGGYLVGFLVAATLVGWLANRGWDRSLRSSISAMLLGNIAIYVLGIPWLMQAVGVGLLEALELGLYPFVIGDVLKLLIAAGILPVAWRLVRR